MNCNILGFLIIILIFGCFRLGFLALFLSDPFISGFTTGAAIHVFSSQIKYLFGVPVSFYTGPFKLIYFYIEFFSRLRLVNPVTITASVTCIFVLILVKEGINSNPSCKDNLPVPVPIELIVVSNVIILPSANELVANGMCNLIGPLFGSFCCSASLSRSLVQSSAGGFTQL
ncbi:hypothetical protein KUTeg_021220 [Tegillarca granosa]|uniref:SLC26A/SulP transporter domain-containing protein n=1 Tax=Tegillarca granosa TaxID=220873 RepID=A0ABQ9EG50_TEGGR|nr:hypothetical protein KUTeg_021220 [Tegillarca granosa]